MWETFVALVVIVGIFAIPRTISAVFVSCLNYRRQERESAEARRVAVEQYRESQRQRDAR